MEPNRAARSLPLPLQSQWTFWHDKNVSGASPQEYEANLVPLHTVDTVQDFWRVYNNIPGPEKLQNRCSIHFMKVGVKPLWEDPKNKQGGCWSFRVRKEESGMVWRETLMALIGEQLDGTLTPGDEIVGISVGNRWNSDLFQLWNTRADLQKGSSVMKRITELLNNVELSAQYYKAHRDHAEFKS